MTTKQYLFVIKATEKTGLTRLDFRWVIQSNSHPQGACFFHDGKAAGALS